MNIRQGLTALLTLQTVVTLGLLGYMAVQTRDFQEQFRQEVRRDNAANRAAVRAEQNHAQAVHDDIEAALLRHRRLIVRYIKCAFLIPGHHRTERRLDRCAEGLFIPDFPGGQTENGGGGAQGAGSPAPPRRSPPGPSPTTPPPPPPCFISHPITGECLVRGQ